MKPVAFDYARPESVDEALAVLAEVGDDAAPLAGGLSLGPMLNFRMARPTVVIDLNHVTSLAEVTINDATIDDATIDDAETRTGATVRQADAMADGDLMAAVPLLAKAFPHIGHYQTRARGTLGGSAAHADPSAELPLALATLGGTVELASRGATRSVPAADFFEAALTTARAEDELLVALNWPARKPGAGYAFDEIAQRRGDFAIVAAAAWLVLDGNGNVTDGALGLGGVEDRPRVFDLKAAMGGSPVTDDGIAAAVEAALAPLDPMSDPVADADYRRQLARVLGARVLNDAASDAGAGAP